MSDEITIRPNFQTITKGYGATTEIDGWVDLAVDKGPERFDHTNRSHILSMLAAYLTWQQSMPDRVLDTEWVFKDFKSAERNHSVEEMNINIENYSPHCKPEKHYSLHFSSKGRKHLKHSVKIDSSDCVDKKDRTPDVKFEFTLKDLEHYQTLNGLSNLTVEQGPF
tara:strand:- start:428 stop:925 length:498 start_codon:yes stop_codon:yes gene_type:complete